MKYLVAVLMLLVIHTTYCSEEFDTWRDVTDEVTSRDFRDEDFSDDNQEIDKRYANQGIGYCYASGDPHYVTFDGRRYDFMGACRYVHVTDFCGHNDHKGINFKVVSDNHKCGGRVSCVHAVDVTIGSEVIHLKRGTQAPANLERPGYSVKREKNNVVVRSKPAGLTVYWNMQNRLEIRLDQRFRGKVCGLCGNFNGKIDSHYTKSDGQWTKNVNEFGQSWKAGGKCGSPVAPLHPCEKSPHRRAMAERDCSIIKSDDFKNCRGAVDLEALYHNCVYDVCAETTFKMKDSSCEAIVEASEECREKSGGKPVGWGHLEQRCHCQRRANLLRGGADICCHFPFKSNGKTYYNCVNVDLVGPVCSGSKELTRDNMGRCLPQ